MGTHGKFAFDSIEFVITLRNLRTELVASPQASGQQTLPFAAL